MPRGPVTSLFSRRIDARRLTLVCGVLLAAVFVAGAATFLAGTRMEQIETRKRATAALALLLSEHARQTITAADLVVQSLVDLAKDEDVRTPEDVQAKLSTRRIHEAMLDRIRGVPQIDVATVVALDGRVINFTRSFPAPLINLSDRDYFQAHKADAQLSFFIGTSVQNKGNGTWTFYIARKLRAPDGTVLGLALAGIRVDFLQAFFRDARPNDFTIALLRADSSLLARFPTADALLGRTLGDASPAFQALKAGETAVVTTVPPIDAPNERSTRILAPKAVAGFPLFVSVSAPEHVVFAEWRRLLNLTIVIVGAVLVIVLAVTLIVSRLLRRQLDDRDALAEAGALARRREHELELSRLAQDSLRNDSAMKAAAIGFTAELAAWVSRLDGLINEFSRLATDLVAAADAAASASTAASQDASSAAREATDVARVAEKTSEHAVGISYSVSETVRTFGRVEEEIERSNGAIAQLAEATSQIAAVSKMISTVASQTNLLALNATIEAARAGESGRGFAVVAGEVKSLAAQTAAATSEIELQIGSIQTAASACIAAVQGIRQRILETEKFSRTIQSTVADQTASAAHLADTLKRSADHSRRVHDGASSVTEVAEVSRDISAALAELASEMKRQAADSARRIQRFRRDYGSEVLDAADPRRASSVE